MTRIHSCHLGIIWKQIYYCIPYCFCFSILASEIARSVFTDKTSMLRPLISVGGIT